MHKPYILAHDIGTGGDKAVLTGPRQDPGLSERDMENAPLKQDVVASFRRESGPHVPDARINTAIRDPKDGENGT